jgi:hypothetical protein
MFVYDVIFYIFWSWMKSSKFAIFTKYVRTLKIFFHCSVSFDSKIFFFVWLFYTNMWCFVSFASLSCFQEVFLTNHFWKYDFVFKISITKLSSRVKISVLKKNLAIRRNNFMLNIFQKKKRILFWLSFERAISTMFFSLLFTNWEAFCFFHLFNH